MTKYNYFVILFKKINLFITNLLKKYLNKLNFSNLKKKKSNILSSYRVFLGLILLIIISLSYISFPNIYNKNEISRELKNQLLDRFGVNFIFSNKLNYKFFPRPHFIIEDSIILNNQKEISDVKKLKIYVSLNNLYSLENIKLKDILLEDANFYLDKQNYNFFFKLLDNEFLESNFKIKDSNIFYKNANKEVLFINKIVKMNYYYDANNLQNVVFSKNKIFNIPYSLELTENKNENKLFSKINLNILKLKIVNEFNYSEDIKKGYTNFIYRKNKNIAIYKFDGNSFLFDFFEKLKEPKFYYKSIVNLNPFYTNFTGKTDDINLSILFDSNAFLAQLLKTEILNNKNLSINFSINGSKIKHYKNFVNIFLNSKIQEGLIDIDNTKFSWNNHVNFNIFDSLIYINKNQLILDGKLLIKVLKPKQVYKYLLTPKNYRQEIKNIELNFDYNFDLKLMNINNVKIDNQSIQKVNDVVKNLNFKNDILQNKIYLKNILNSAIKAYAG
jgi:hypothetical protein